MYRASTLSDISEAAVGHKGNIFSISPVAAWFGLPFPEAVRFRWHSCANNLPPAVRACRLGSVRSKKITKPPSKTTVSPPEICSTRKTIIP